MGSKQSIIEGTRREYTMKFAHRTFEENLNENSAHQRALIYDDPKNGVRETSFDTLNKKSNSLASSILQLLKDVNAKPNQDGDYIVVVCMTTNDFVITTLLAIWKAGAAYLPIEPTFPHIRIAHIVCEAKPVLVIYDEYEDLSVFDGAISISFSELMLKSIGCKEENIETQHSLTRGEEDVAIILYTSGSTGTPKGVRIPHSAVFNKLQWLRQTFPFSDTEKVAALNSPLINVDSVAELWGPLLTHVAVLIIPQEVTKDPSQLVAALEIYKVERLVLFPTLLSSLLTYLSLQDEHFLSSLKTWICCGETLMTSLAQEFFNYFNDGTHVLCNFYGSTEMMGDVSYYTCESMDQLDGLSKVPIGYPLDNTAIFILDNNLNPVKLGNSGEIFVTGLNLAKGYVNGRDKGRFIFNRFTDNPKFDRLYRTGDFGTILKDGSIQYEGRMDSQINVSGNRVDIIEVEKTLRSIEDVNKGVVLCFHAGESDQALLAFVTLNNKPIGSTNQQGIDIENILKPQLIDYQMPHVIVVEVIPILPNGKIDTQTLLKWYENIKKKDDSNFDYTAISEDKLEIAKDVFQTIGEVIGRSSRGKFSMKSNFYELGGNSLNSVFTVAQLRNRGYFIGVTDFITANCLGDVLNKIFQNGKEQIVEENAMQLKVIPLTTHHKHQTISIITSSFYEKSDLGKWLKPLFLYSDYKEFVEQIWEHTLEKGLSFAVTDSKNNIIGVAINFDGGDEPEISLSTKVMIIFDFLKELERPVKEKELPQGTNRVFHSFIMGTSAQLTAQENVAVIQKMEDENLCLAKEKNFDGILTTNTSPLTQQFGTYFYGYQTMADCQVNEYIHHDGSKPFEKAPNSQRVIVHWKDITRN